MKIVVAHWSMSREETEDVERCRIRTQPVGSDGLRLNVLIAWQAPHQSQCRSRIAPLLDHHVHHLTFVIDGAPDVDPLAVVLTISSRCQRGNAGAFRRRWLAALFCPKLIVQQRTISLSRVGQASPRRRESSA